MATFYSPISARLKSAAFSTIVSFTALFIIKKPMLMHHQGAMRREIWLEKTIATVAQVGEQLKLPSRANREGSMEIQIIFSVQKMAGGTSTLE